MPPTASPLALQRTMTGPRPEATHPAGPPDAPVPVPQGPVQTVAGGEASPAAVPPMKRPLRVVYVLGTGRCGSTLLDLMLGLAPDGQSTGELWTLARPIAREEAPCSCGAPASSCPFWSGVLERLPSGAGLPELARASRSFDRLRALPLTFVARSLGTPAYRAHAERIRALYEAIAARGGRPILVDSSKDPVRALSVGSAGGTGLEVL